MSKLFITSQMTAKEAISYIQTLYPPDSEYEDTRVIGRKLMDCSVGNKVGYDNWRNLSDTDLLELARLNLLKSGEYVI